MPGATIGTRLAKAALLCTSIGASLVVCELLLRMLGYAAIYEVYSKPELLWQHDYTLGWSHEPDSVANYVGPRPWPVEFDSRVEINSLGLNGPLPADLPEDGIRILFLGDSMVAGFEVQYEETFCALIAKLLSEKLGRRVEVVNAGVRGYGTDQAYLYFRERGKTLRPDLVLHWLSENDLLDDITIHRMRRMFGKPAFVEDGDGELKLVGSPVPQYPECSEYRIGSNREIERVDSLPGRAFCRLQLALFDRSALFSFVTTLLATDRWGALVRDLYYLGMPKPTLEDDPQSEAAPPPITRRLLRQLEIEAKESGAGFKLVGTPSVFRFFAASGVDIDPEGMLVLDRVEAADPAVKQFQHDSHYTAAGHRLVAEQLAELLTPIIAELESRPH